MYEETEAVRLSDLPEVTVGGSGEAGIQPQAGGPQTSVSVSL